MSVTAKVWGAIGREPPDGVTSDVDTHPPNWFREAPAFAAELYALEVYGRDTGRRKIRVNVRDTDGILHEFDVSLRPTVEASVRRIR